MKVWIGAFGLLLLLVAGCSKSGPSGDQSYSVTGSGATGGSDPRLALMCVQVFYDGETDSSGADTLPSGDGRLYADMIANLLGHFHEIQPIERPAGLYQKGDFDKCAANIYAGSDFYAVLSTDFLNDFVTTPSRVAWLGYGFWNLGDQLNTVFGATYVDLMDKDAPVQAGDDPGFYRDVLYKGEVFPKYGKYEPVGSSTGSAIGSAIGDRTVFDCDCEVAKIKINDATKSTVLAQIRHSVSGAKIPYAIQAGTKFLFADLPLSYIYEADRYNVFADVLFDIVNLPARHTQHYAAIRLEDIHSQVDLTTLDEAMSIFKTEGVTPNLSMIPLFADPLAEFSPRATTAPIPASSQATFMQHVDQYKAQGAVFLWHGVTHQFESTKNPYDGVSGDDYEFWDYDNNRPWSVDTESWFTNRLSWGQNVLLAMGLNPTIWVTPHYVASALDNGVLARLMPWSMGRITYFTTSTTDGLLDYTQFFPYEIFRDTYGTHLIPENLNYVSTDPANPNSVDDMLTNAKRNLVLRDSWASAFYHPYLLAGQDASATDLQKLIQGLKDLGYIFVNLETCTDTEGCLKN